jgi:chemotaxis protein MotB
MPANVMTNLPTTLIDDDEPAGWVPDWFITFADMMTLLLAFFIMLLSMSKLEEPTQVRAIVTTLREQFGNNPAQGEADTNLIVPANADDIPDGGPLANTRPGGVIFFGDFDTELTEEHKRQLSRIAEEIAETDSTIEIRGHAGQVNIDPRSGVRDLWDLADRRCRSTMQFLVERGVEPSQIRLANAGASEPLYNGIDAARLRENSRVEVKWQCEE